MSGHVRKSAARAVLAAPFDRESLRQSRRAAIIRAAASAFNRGGYHSTSMDELAALLNTSKPTLYQYFPNKQKLLLACHELAMDHGEAGLRLASASGRSGLEKLEIYCGHYMHGIMDDLGACAVLTDVHALLPGDREAVIARRERISQATRDLIAEGRADGSIGEVDPVAATLLVLGAMNYILIWYRPDGPRTRDEIVDSFLATFRRGLASQPG